MHDHRAEAKNTLDHRRPPSEGDASDFVILM